MFFSSPDYVTEQIARRANQLAREWTAARGWNGTRYLQPTWGEGMAGIKTTRRYLMYQNTGTNPFLMRWAEGRTIPIGRRLVKAVGVGQPGFVNLPIIKTNRFGKAEDTTQKIWRNQKWLHPGLKPQGFLERSLSQAMNEHEFEIAEAAQHQFAQWIMDGMPEDSR